MFSFLSRLFASFGRLADSIDALADTTDAVNGKLRERLALDGPADAPRVIEHHDEPDAGGKPNAQRQGPRQGGRVLTRPLLGDAKRRPKGRPGRAPRPEPAEFGRTFRVRPT